MSLPYDRPMPRMKWGRGSSMMRAVRDARAAVSAGKCSLALEHAKKARGLFMHIGRGISRHTDARLTRVIDDMLYRVNRCGRLAK